MKAFLMARESQVQTILSPADAEQMLATDYLRVVPRPKARGKDAKRMRLLRRQRQAEGWLSLDLWLSPDEVAAVTAIKRPGETYAELLVRLVKERGLL
ncbi:hypothetical protein [Pseudomonas sp. Irchel s3b6]|uniref:hypothetical protein n=1 Tax=Pseudomonas sp. Irchel s3b6 TaxID=2009078 RepID=UPI0011403E46|nr:hypothetical protein [Pseudomonas sp. Irchel s3b6]